LGPHDLQRVRLVLPGGKANADVVVIIESEEVLTEEADPSIPNGNVGTGQVRVLS
jgi:hypothetical protein